MTERKTRPRERKSVKISSEFLFEFWRWLGKDQANSIPDEISMCVAKWAKGNMSDKELGWRIYRIRHNLLVLLELFQEEKEVKEVMDDQRKYDEEYAERNLGSEEDLPF